MSEDTSSNASASDSSHSSDYSESLPDRYSDGVPRAFLDLPLEVDSVRLEYHLSKYVPYGCATPTGPVWPDTGFVGEYYQPVASFLNSTLDVAREAFEKSDKEVEYCALDFLFTKQFRWTVYNKSMGPPEHSSDMIARPALVGCKLNDTSLFDDSTQSVKVDHHVDQSHLITYADIDNRNIYRAIFKSSLTGRTTVDAQPNRVAIRSIVLSIEDGTIKAAIADLDAGGIQLTHLHNLKNDGEYERFRALLVACTALPSTTMAATGASASLLMRSEICIFRPFHTCPWRGEAWRGFGLTGKVIFGLVALNPMFFILLGRKTSERSGYQKRHKDLYMREVADDTNQAGASSRISLADVYAAHGPLDLVKAVLGAIYGFRNVYRVGWTHKQIGAKNITVGPTRDFKLYDYNVDTAELVPIKYDIDCLIGDAEEGLCGMLIAYDLGGEKEEEDVDDGDDLGLFSESLCFMANQKYEDVHFFPATQSTIGGLESFLWVLIYVLLRHHTQGGTFDTPDGHLYNALFGRLPESDAKRSEFLAQKGVSKDMFGEGRCLAPLKNLLTPALKFFRYQYSWCLDMMAKEGPGTYPWTEEEEKSSLDECVDILSRFVQEEAVKKGKQPEKL
ncbi:hypothetical protein L198_07615 [Cryptococcus wingfieldii CBS 7118]|uniref:Fungal-type protein kinase domain-containing protein n=1 Tax=Cryptococcus wingfieldii CBS 7118 TaxID=1295528 RepID=A0A1E3I5Y7_9TREE|nr:hypothetical protein L198_07615 [Cryptococcus wingfieldii CBS 7118]ODN83918.1 hypothetical protein L198_07615 [Cryptococcus wingfieldii CBS 7118]